MAQIKSSLFSLFHFIHFAKVEPYTRAHDLKALAWVVIP